MLKTGVVLEANKVSTYIITCDSEFFNLQTKNSKPPQIGEIYTGELYKRGRIFYKLILLLVIISLSSYGLMNVINKTTPVYSVVVEINSSVQLTVNNSNEILEVKPLNSKGVDLVKDLDLYHKTLDIALTMLLEKANKLKYLDSFYSKKENSIHIYITNHNNSLVYLTSFKTKADELKITVLINDNGK